MLNCLSTPAAFAQLDENDRALLKIIEQLNEMPADSQSLSNDLLPYMQSAAALLKADPNDYRAHFLLGQAYDKLGMEDLAQSEYEASKHSLKSYRNFVLSALKDKLSNNEFSSALVYYPFARELDPNDSSVIIMDAIELGRQGKIEEEEALLSKVIQSAGTQTGVFSTLGSVRFQQGKYAEAIELFNKELSKSPEFEPALLGKARALEASRHYLECIRIAVPLYLKNTLRFELAELVTRAECQLGRYQEAMQPALVSLAVAKQETQMKRAKNTIIFLWPRLAFEQRQAALKEVSDVLDKTIYGARMHFALGDALQKAGFVHAAEEQFRLGLKLEPRHANAYKHLAEIFQYNYHNRSAAIFNYFKYLSYAGNDELIVKRRQRLIDEAGRYKDVALRIKNKANEKAGKKRAAQK